MINRDKVHELVKLFYQPTYKTFYVNSEDGKDLTRPLGVFVSLGMTTSLKTLTDIKDFINGNKNYNAILAEISSKKVGDQFINTVTNQTDPKQYKLEEFPSNIMTKEEVYKELEEMKDKMNPNSSLELLTEYGPKVHKLEYLATRLTESNGWDSHMIQRDGEKDYRIFHNYVNYLKKDGVEYRIGIYVTEANEEVS